MSVRSQVRVFGNDVIKRALTPRVLWAIQQCQLVTIGTACLVQLSDESLRRPQICRLESFREASIDGCQEFVCFH